MRVSSRFRLLCHALVAALIAAYLVSIPISPAAAAPVATPGAGPVNRPLPATATANHGLPAGVSSPPVPPALATDGGRPRVPTAAEKARRKAVAKTLAAALRPGTPIVRPGFLLGDTSLVVYWDAEVNTGDPNSWGRWFATVTDTETGAEQRSTERTEPVAIAAALLGQAQRHRGVTEQPHRVRRQ